VRVRLTDINSADLNLFQFDFDLTIMVFFVNADERVYGRYGGRDAKGADTRQSLAGLHYAMRAALDAHRAAKADGPKRTDRAMFVRDLVGGRRRDGCVHCHQVKEMLHADLKKNGKWNRDHIWRYPLPDNLGLVLEVDRGNVVERVEHDSPAQRAGLRSGDLVKTLGGLRVHSFADAQFALDAAPKSGKIDISWQRHKETLKGQLTLPDGWRKTDITWRRSMDWVVPAARVYGRDLTVAERRARGLSMKQLAFWQGYPVSSVAKAVGVQEDDIILGFDGKQLEMNAFRFQSYVRENYLVGDKVTIDVLRGDKRLSLPMKLRSSL
jgi:hypothetical protein